uniref:Protein kinase domain-containing protein n=1 Tax=viral metagenome TaxID=1070528 RepID=A0A6C0BCK9_9ZZZZ
MFFIVDIYNPKFDHITLHSTFNVTPPNEKHLMPFSSLEILYNKKLLNPIESEVLRVIWPEFVRLAKNGESLDKIIEKSLPIRDIAKVNLALNTYTLDLNNNSKKLYSYLICNPIIKDYREIKELGRGSYGVVYLAFDKNRNRVVVKKIRKQGHDDEEKEYENLNLLKSQCNNYYTCLIECINESEYFYIVMEYNEGYITLQECIKDRSGLFLTSNSNELPPIVKMMINLYNGIKDMHSKGVVHKDIKPDNIMVDPSTGNIKFIDFGLSCHGRKCEMTYGSSICGTPLYMDPYQNNFGGRRYISPTDVAASDCWSLGITIYEMLTGSTPAELFYLNNKSRTDDQNIDLYFREYSYLKDPKRAKINELISSLTNVINLDILLDNNPSNRKLV